MGRRSNFPRIEKDSYPTPLAAVLPLLARLPPGTRFLEPCAGAGLLIEHLTGARHILVGAYDLPVDARTTRYAEVEPGVVIVTNPPWERPVLHEIIVNLSNQAPTWLLLDLNWLFTAQSTPFHSRIRTVVVVGRCRWIPDSPFTGMEDCGWILFDRPWADGCVRLVGRSGVRGAA